MRREISAIPLFCIAGFFTLAIFTNTKPGTLSIVQSNGLTYRKVILLFSQR